MGAAHAMPYASISDLLKCCKIGTVSTLRASLVASKPLIDTTYEVRQKRSFSGEKMRGRKKDRYLV